ncbi:MAG: hypothetical protein BAA04_09355 [Firmicutes bacterium ZCTH02-B6]|nr:MAG: hypothetical protein BAA04_09355 [Firmicutes bacterium ZCTH02-B6]
MRGPETPGKAFRQARLFETKSGRSVVVAVDHALDHGDIPGLDDMEKTLAALMEEAPDGLIVRPATLKRYHHILAQRGGPALIAALDSRMTASLPGGDTIGEEHRLAHTVEEALALGADAVKVLLIFGRKDLRVHADNLERVARVIAAGDRWGVPVMVETVLWGLSVPKERQNDPALVPHIARIGAELGADIIKAPYAPGVYSSMTRRLPVPVMILGGGRVDREEDFYASVAQAMAEGAAGVAIGRNVWQAQDPAQVVRRLKEIVYAAGA